MTTQDTTPCETEPFNGQEKNIIEQNVTNETIEVTKFSDLEDFREGRIYCRRISKIIAFPAGRLIQEVGFWLVKPIIDPNQFDNENNVIGDTGPFIIGKDFIDTFYNKTSCYEYTAICFKLKHVKKDTHLNIDNSIVKLEKDHLVGYVVDDPNSTPLFSFKFNDSNEHHAQFDAEYFESSQDTLTVHHIDEDSYLLQTTNPNIFFYREPSQNADDIYQINFQQGLLNTRGRNGATLGAYIKACEIYAKERLKLTGDEDVKFKKVHELLAQISDCLEGE